MSKNPVKTIEIIVEENYHSMTANVMYKAEFEHLSRSIMEQVSIDFVARIVAKITEDHYLEIVKSLDMEALTRLITLEVSKQVAGKVLETT